MSKYLGTYVKFHKDIIAGHIATSGLANVVSSIKIG